MPGLRIRFSESPSLGRKALWIGVALLVITGSVSALFGERGYLQVRRYQAQRAEIEEEIRGLEEEIRLLRREIIELREGNQAMERLAREELILSRPGEVLFLFPREDDTPRPAESGAASGI